MPITSYYRRDFAMPPEVKIAGKKNNLTSFYNRNNMIRSFISTQYFYYISCPHASDQASDHHHLPIEDGY